MEESLLYIQRIKAMYQSRTFSKSDRLIADYILAHPTCVASTTAAELGEVTGTSSATVVRFCRKLGFSGLVDLKMSMAYRYANGENIIMDLDRGDNVHQIKQKVISFTKMVADHLMESLDDQALACAAQEILRAEQLVIVGEGGSGTICRAAYDIFLKLAIQCRYVSDPLFQAMEIGSMKQTDVLLLIVNSGRTANMVQNAQLAHACGIKTIGIVGSSNSPISQYLDIEIRTSLFRSDYFSDLAAARTCELTAISILSSLCPVTRRGWQKDSGSPLSWRKKDCQIADPPQDATNIIRRPPLWGGRLIIFEY